MINVGDKVRLIKTTCGNCEVCKEAMSGYSEVLPGDLITVDLPKGGICNFDERECEFDVYIPSLENK